MQHPGNSRPGPAPDPPKPGVEREYGEYVDTGRHGIVRRVFTTGRHVYGLLIGGFQAWLRGLAPEQRRRPRNLLLRAVAWVLGLPVSRSLRRKPFPVQLRIRFERLGATYIKLGQILSMREDLLPREITDELKNLLDRLPALPFKRFVAIVEAELGRPIEECFTHVRSAPLGSASIGQAHLATMPSGERVILKVVKPGIVETLKRDTILLRGLALLLQPVLPRFQPRRLAREFREYTLREMDLRQEADNAETFAYSFRDDAGVVFPRIYRRYCTRRLLCMEYLDGIKPTDARAQELSQVDRERLVDTGAAAIIRMIYRDGFFHADLHPANLLILPGPRLGFIDLGMVGRFGTDLRRALLYYFYSLVMGDAENAAHYLAMVAETRADSDPAGFRRDVEEVCRRWSQRARFQSYSLGHLIMESLAQGVRHKMYFPVEMVLMIKAIVTFEGVGSILMPGGVDVAEASKKHLNRILIERFAPTKLARESLTGLPEMVDAITKAPRLVSEGLRLVEQAARRPQTNPFAGVRATLFGGACLIAGAVLAGFGQPWPLWVGLMIVGILLPLRRGA